MARLSYPHLKDPDLSRVLRAIIDQLNAVSDERLAASTTADTAPPTNGSFARGDFIRNTKPAAGGPLGWVCVANGTPGTWAAININ